MNGLVSPIYLCDCLPICAKNHNLPASFEFEFCFMNNCMVSLVNNETAIVIAI